MQLTMPGMMQTLKTLAIMLVVTTGINAADTCGTYQYTDLVVRGTPVLDPSDWPWIAGLFHQTDEGPEFQCGATLVSRSVVVTAAHCVVYFYDGKYYTIPADDITVVIGRSSVHNWTEQENLQTRTAQNVVVHPSYRMSRRNGADFAYIEMDHPINITDSVTPICLWNVESDVYLTGYLGTVVGWGRDENNVSVTETPRKAELLIVGKRTCISSNGKFRKLVKRFQFCAGSRDGSGPCNGDSGSGLYVTRTQPDGEKKWVMRGLVSRSLNLANDSGICDLSNYIIFTDVGKLVPWMKSTSCSFRHPHIFGALNMTRLREKYYHFNLDWEKRLKWTSAQQFCRSHGLQLASIETEEENKLIVEYIRGKRPANTWELYFWQFWLSGSDSQQEGTWRWSNGQPLTPNFTYQSWLLEQMSNYSEYSDCLLMVVDGVSDGSHEWWDLPCSVEKRFVCELEDVCS